MADLPKVPSSFQGIQDKATLEALNQIRRFLEQLVKRPSGGGAGTIQEITSSDLSVIVTDPTGPIVDLSVSGSGGAVDDVTAGSNAIVVSPTTGSVVVSLDESELENGGAQELNLAGMSGLLATAQTPAAHKTSHENSGSDEISVAGLSGQLADGQRASALITSGADVVVSAAAPPSVGQVLSASSATVASWSSPTGPASEYWSKLTSAGAPDEEMDGSSFPPSGWTLYRVTSALAATATGVSQGQNANLGALTSAATDKFEWYYENSWLNFSVGAFTGTDLAYYLCRRITARPKYGIYRARLRTYVPNTSNITPSGDFLMMMAKETSSLPDVTGNRYSGIHHQAGEVRWRSSPAAGTYANWGASNQIYTQDGEVFLYALDTDVYVGLKSDASLLVNGGGAIGTGYATGNAVYIGFWITPGLRGAIDYQRELTHASTQLGLR